METTTIILVLSLVAGFLMAFSLGANDVSNSMAPAVGAKAITIKQAVVISALLNCLGAIFLGSHVTATISTGIVSPDVVPDRNLFMLGMFAALLASGIFVLFATFTGLPVSSTHALVGSIAGFGLVLGGAEAVSWKMLISIVICWVLAPFMGAVLGYFVFVHIRKTILYSARMLHGALRWLPFWIALTVVLIVLSLLFKTPVGKRLDLGFWSAIGVAAVLFALTIFFCRLIFPPMLKKKGSSTDKVEEIFRRMQVYTACFLSLSHGANDVSNAIGPVVAVYIIARKHDLVGSLEIPLWLLLLGGVGIALGTMMMGRKVMATVGQRITQINNSRGFAVSFGAATTVLMATNLGMPVSTTHATVGSVVGVGLARGFAAVDFRVLGKIFISWILTVPAAGFLCILLFLLLEKIFYG